MILKDFTPRYYDVCSSPDNKYIPRVSNAGKIIDNYLIMHNGLKIHPLNYYGIPNLKMLILNRGVHEPQQERIFLKIPKHLPDNAVMIEMGSHWAFYSIWFNNSIKNAKYYIIEPDLIGLEFGKLNFKINNMKGTFYRAFIHSKSKIKKTKRLENSVVCT